MPTLPATRVNYFDRQHIRLSELRDEQAYHTGQRRRHNLSHHSWGIVVGLDLVTREDGQIAVTPGLAIDGYGRELLSLDYIVLTRDEFDRRGTSRLDVWLEYGLDRTDDGPGGAPCDASGTDARYRAVEIARIVLRPGGALPDPRRPVEVPAEAFDPPQLDTPDDPLRRWPVYLGRVIMDLSSGQPAFVAETSDRVYIGLMAEVIDHPGNETRIEIGHRPVVQETREIGSRSVTYVAGPDRDFAIFVPNPNLNPGAPLEPRLLVQPAGTQIIGDTNVHGNLIMDGTAVVFPVGMDQQPDTGNHPAIYRFKDELRIDAGSDGTAQRTLVIGVTKDGEFKPAIEVSFPSGEPLVKIFGDVRIEGNIDCEDVRVRTLTADAAAQITAMLQAAALAP
jgi:hypothetical protein